MLHLSLSILLFFFFSSRRRHTRCLSDWSSDVCSSDLPRSATRAVNEAQFVVQLSAFETGLEYADVLLPIAPFTETAGTFVNTEGRLQSFHAAVNPLGESRPGWKVLRVLGTLLGKPGTGFDSIDEVRADCLRGRDVSSLLSNRTQVELSPGRFDPPGIQRIADGPI